MSTHKPHNQEQKKEKKCFFCPLGYAVMWWHGLEYKDCPLNAPYRDMPECANCKLKFDKKWESTKETWKDEPRKKKKKNKNRRKNNERKN